VHYLPPGPTPAAPADRCAAAAAAEVGAGVREARGANVKIIKGEKRASSAGGVARGKSHPMLRDKVGRCTADDNGAAGWKGV
jgi:hypothetical protein